LDIRCPVTGVSYRDQARRSIKKNSHGLGESNMTRIKEDIIRDVMSKIALDRNTAGHLVESVLRNIKDTLASGDGVMISGFGEFKVKHKRARRGRNPKTKIEYEISERTVVTFHTSKVFRREMNQD